LGTICRRCNTQFEDSHHNQPQVLKILSKIGKFLENKRHEEARADLSAVGDDIANIDPVPAQMKIASPALASAYREIGAQLSRDSRCAGR